MKHLVALLRLLFSKESTTPSSPGECYLAGARDVYELEYRQQQLNRGAVDLISK